MAGDDPQVGPRNRRMKIATEVTIDAASETVWRILADTARYPQWNPYIPELHGTLAMGAPEGGGPGTEAVLTLPGAGRPRR